MSQSVRTTLSHFSKIAPWIVGPIILIAFLPASKAQQDRDAEIVQQFFPQTLVTEWNSDFKPSADPPAQASDFDHLTVFVRADLDGTGTADYLVAAYSNGVAAVVRVIKEGAVVAEPSLPSMSGAFLGITLIDLDGDGRPEVVVAAGSGTGSAWSSNWIFKWDGRNLNFIGPSEIDSQGNVSTVLGNADFVDLVGDGRLDLVNPPEPDDPSGSYTVFAMVGGIYKPTNLTFDFYDTFVRAKDEPATTTESFSIADPNAAYMMTIVTTKIFKKDDDHNQGRHNHKGDDYSDDRDGGDKQLCTADIYLNGNQIALPRMLNPKAPALRIPISVKSSNSISVTVTGTPESEVTIGIGPN